MTRFLSQPRWRYIGEYMRWKTGRFDLIRAGWAAGLLLMTRSSWPVLHFLARCLARKRDAPVVLMQHDVDRVPFRTYDLLEVEKRFGVRSSNYFFFESAYHDGEPYELDVDRMQSLESDGWEIGYHQNAYELAAFDKACTPKVLARDVEWFRERFNLRSYVPHGGAKGPNGENNSDWPHGGALSGLVCAFNGPCILKEFFWGDGGAEWGGIRVIRVCSHGICQPVAGRQCLCTRSITARLLGWMSMIYLFPSLAGGEPCGVDDFPLDWDWSISPRPLSIDGSFVGSKPQKL